MRFRNRWLAVCLAFAVSSCCSDPPPEKATDADEIEYELFPSTRELGASELEALTSSEDDGTLVFAAEPPGFEDVKVGQVLIAGMSSKTPAGLLRVVAGIERSRGGLTLRTVAAPLQVAFKRLHAKIRRDASLSDGAFTLDDSIRGWAAVRAASLGQGKAEEQQSYRIVVFDGDGDETTTNDQVTIDADFGGGFTYELSLDIDWPDVNALPNVVEECLATVAKILVGEKPSCDVEQFIPELESTFSVDPFVSLDVDVKGAATLDFERNFEVGKATLAVIPLGPVVLVPTIDVLASVKGGASARFEVGAMASAEVSTSVTVSTKTGGQPQVSPPKLKSFHFDTRPPVIDLHASAEAKVGARLGMSLYGVAGPYATLSGVARIDASPFDDPCWGLRLGLESTFGARITSPRLPVVGHVTLVDWKLPPFRPIEEEVATGTCLVPPEPPLPPGGGPTAGTFQNPPFTPWAKVLGGDVDGTYAPPIGNILDGATELFPTIDGRFTVTGRFAREVHKFDGEGALTWTSKLGKALGGTRPALRSVPTPDAGLLALLPDGGEHSFLLSRLTQAGALSWTRGYSLPNDCVAQASHLLRDAGNGFVVLGRCLDGGRGFLVRLDARGDVVGARTIEEPGALRLVPNAGAKVENEVVIAGKIVKSGEPDWVFVSRLDRDGRPNVTTAFSCPERVAIEPAHIAPSENGGVTIVGEANGPGFVARVRKDGALGFARFPNLGLGVADWLGLTSVAELPTTGMLVAGSTFQTASDSPPSLVLAGVDGSGRTLWARRYSLTGSSKRALTWPALRLTDDGGALVAALAGPGDGREGELVAMKVPAKDGSLGAGLPVTSAALTPDAYTCQMTTRTVTLDVKDVVVTVR